MQEDPNQLNTLQKIFLIILGTLLSILLFFAALKIWLIQGVIIELLVTSLLVVAAYKKSHHAMVKKTLKGFAIGNVLLIIVSIIGTTAFFSFIQGIIN